MPDIANEHTRRDLGLPIREFLYTPDQIAFLIDVQERRLREFYLHYDGRSIGVCPRDRMLAVNITPADAPGKPEWRIAEKHFKRWLRFKGWRVYNRGYIG